MKKKILLWLTLGVYLFAVDATMEIIKNRSTIPTIAYAISQNTQVENEIDKQILNLIKKDLEVSGHFNNSPLVTENNFFQNPNYTILEKNNIDLYLVLNVKRNDPQGIIVDIKFYDNNIKKLVLSKSYSTTSQARYPFLSHKIAIDINGYLNAPSIAWMDRFVIFSRYLDSKTSEIVVSDYTLTYQKVVVRGGLNIFPKWANKEQTDFYFTTYNYQYPSLMKQNLYTSKTEKLLESDGMIVCSDVSADGEKLVLTMAPNSQPDIYIYETKTKLKTRVTHYNGIDVGGSFVENDKKVIFVSDRLRYPNIFAKTIGQSGVERLIYHGKNNSQSSTFQNYIVYSSRESDNEFDDNVFNLYLMSTFSDHVRRLTTNGRNQFPKFSSDGESILFIKEDSKNYLGIIRLNYDKSFLFPLKTGKLQSIDW